MTRLLLLGGGHAHALVLLQFRQFVSKELQVTLVNPGPVHTYSGMVPGVIAGHYAPADAQVDLSQIAARAGVELAQDTVRSIDPGAKEVGLAGGQSLRYDILSINLGSVPAGAGEAAIAVKPFDGFFARWRELLEKGSMSPCIAVIGAGAAGVELAMAMKFALAGRGKVVLFSDRNMFPDAVAERVRNVLRKIDVEMKTNAPVRAEFDAMFQATGPAASPVLRESSLQTDVRGFVLVDPCLRSVSHPDVFAAGDAASLEHTSVPKSGVYAVRQGAVLAENLKRAVRGMPMLDYVPQRESLSLLSCGGKYAIASRGGWSAEGRWVWWWKNWLDRRWVAKFR